MTTQNEPSRKPPRQVRDILAAEVNFGCPVAGCGCPFLTWHHFDPPWCVRKHHEPDGMVALCASHASFADGGHWSNAQLRALKNDPFVKSRLSAVWPWDPEEILFVLGGSVFVGPRAVLALRGRPLLEAKRAEVESTAKHQIVFDAHVTKPDGEPFLEMEDNHLLIDVADVRVRATTRAKQFEVQHETGVRVGLRFHRYTSEKLAEHLRYVLENVDMVEAAMASAAASATDSDGLIPVVSINGKILTHDWDLTFEKRKTRMKALFYGAQKAELKPRIFDPGGKLSFEYRGTEILSFG